MQAAIDRAVKSTETQADAINKQYGKQNKRLSVSKQAQGK